MFSTICLSGNTLSMIVKDGKVVKVLIFMLNQYGEFGFKLFKDCQIRFIHKF